MLKAVLTLLRFALALAGAKPSPTGVILEADLALIVPLLTGEAGLGAVGFTNNPSLVPGLLLLPFLLSAEVGLGGGPMGDSSGEKKLDLLLSFGVDGIPCKLSIVRSDRLGRDFVLSRGRKSSSSGSAGSRNSIGDSSWKPWRDAARKPSREPSWS